MEKEPPTPLPSSPATEESGIAKQIENAIDTRSIDVIGEDLLQNILSRLPALSFASAACVSRCWNTLCSRVLSRPKLSSAFSLNPVLQDALKEIVNKVLSEPIRPHFAVACISPSFSLPLAHELITEKLGSTTPVVTYESRGVIGKDALTNEFKEVQWDVTVQDTDTQSDNGSPIVTHGILLTVGFVPGLKVDAIPLLKSIEDQDPQVAMVDQFVMDIREYTTSVSGCTSPLGIFLFGDPTTDMKLVLDKIDCAIPLDTVIVGDESAIFLHRRQCESENTMSQKYSSAAVALLFARDRNKPNGIGDIEFHVALSTGIAPIGPTLRAVAVKERLEEFTTWLTGRKEELYDILDGEAMLNDINDEIGDHVEYPGLYVGVTKRRKCTVGFDKVGWVTSLVFHEVTGADEEYLYVYGSGIKTGDSFRFYHSDPSTAVSSCSNVSENFRRWKQDWGRGRRHIARGSAAAAYNGDKKEVFGGMIFTCCGRGENFFGRPNVDSTPFLENFDGVPLVGAYCCGEIGRGSSVEYGQEAEELSNVRCCLHAYSSLYLVMTYTPAPQEY